MAPQIAAARSAARRRSSTPARSAATGEFEMEAEAGNGGVLLNGKKLLVMDAQAADVLLVATSDGRAPYRRHRGVRASAIEARGLDRPDPSLLRGRASRGSRFRAEQTLPAEGEDYFAGLSPRLRRDLRRAVAEAPQRTMEMTVDYAKDRQQFGRPIGSYQAV